MKKFKDKIIKKKETIDVQSFVTSAVSFVGQDSL